MSLLPIDIQTIIGQMGTVGKIQHNAEQAPLVQQNYVANNIEKQTLIKDNQVDKTEKSNGEDFKINPDSKKFSGNSNSKKKENNNYISEEENKEEDLWKDPAVGNIIDIKK